MKPRALLRKTLPAFLLTLCAVPAAALNTDRDTVKLRFVELPAVEVRSLDYERVHAEVAFGEIQVGDPVLRKTTTWCVSEGSDNQIRDAVEIPTHYYEIPYSAGAGVMVVRHGEGEVIYSERIDELESSVRFGYGECAYWMPVSLPGDYERAAAGVRRNIENEVTGYFTRNAERILDRTLFFNIVEEKVPLYTFKDKVHDYADLNRAAELAGQAYNRMRESVAGLSAEGRTDLAMAVAIWERALGMSDLGDEDARINRKVTIRLHESVGVAKLVLGEPAAAVDHLEKSNRYRSMTTSRSDGTGTANLMERARERKRRGTANEELLTQGADLDALMASTERWRGRIRTGVLSHRDLARLEEEHGAFFGHTVIAEAVAEHEEEQAAIASGERNPFEDQVSHTSMQGFILFLMPYPEKRTTFPERVTELEHINRLRIPNHRFDSVPESIGNMKSLEVLDLSKNEIKQLPAAIGLLERLEKLDLSGNQLQSLPEEIGRLENLKVLQLKDNPLAPGELERVKRLLPKCKIKG